MKAFASTVFARSVRGESTRSPGACLWVMLFASLVFSPPLRADPIAWASAQVRSWQPGGSFSIVFTHLPDGRFLLGQQGKVFVQATFGSAPMSEVVANGRTFDPSFIAVRSASSALLGAGGNFGAISGLHPFNPSAPATGVGAALTSTAQNYVGIYWKSPASALEGWLIGGANGPGGPFFGHNVVFVNSTTIGPNAPGTIRGAVTEELCSYSAGIAVDAGGNLYTALYELDGDPNEAEADKVLRFSAAQVETAIQAVIAGTPAPLARGASTFVHRFDSASSIAVDGLGRVWSTGFKVEHLQVYEPSTGRVRALVPDHAPIAGASQRGYQVGAFTHGGTPWLGFLAYDLYGTPGTPVIVGHAPAADVTMPADATFTTWRIAHFGADALTLVTESTVWGDSADPDRDGLANRLEYALGTAPLTPDGATATASGRSGGLLTFSFRRNPLATDLIYIVEASSTLAANDWTPLATSVAGAATVPTTPDGASSVQETAEGAMVRVTVRDRVTAAGAAKRFMRLRVDVP